MATAEPLRALVSALSMYWDLLEQEERREGWGSRRWFALNDQIAMIRSRIQVWW